MEMQLDYTMYFVDLIDEVMLSHQSIISLLEQFVKVKVYNEWILGLNVAIFALIIILIFSTFISNYK